MNRSFLLYFLITLMGLIFIGRLFQLQIIKGETYDPIHNAAVKIEYDYPERGYIYDRNGKLLVANELSYDVMVQPNQVQAIDTLEFCNLLKIDKVDFLIRFQRAEHYASYLPSVFLKAISQRRFCFFTRKNAQIQWFLYSKKNH